MEQTPQNPGAPAQDSAVQGSPLPENTAQSNAVQENTVQNNAAESTTVEATAAPTATALQSPEHDPAAAGAASAAPSEAVAAQNAPAEPKRMGLYALVCIPGAVPLGVSIGGIPLMWLYLTYTTGPNATRLIIMSNRHLGVRRVRILCTRRLDHRSNRHSQATLGTVSRQMRTSDGARYNHHHHYHFLSDCISHG